ncbi:MAG: RluA family pseudouridine synthase [Deltaproteobacteria bacterium]|nr:RluA family pseudouridine synthase [Deltaproteobacteria bacterium]
MRLDVFLRKKYPHITRRELLRFFRDKKILMGSRPALKGDLVTGEENFRLPPEFFQTERRLAPNPKLDVKIVYEDDSIIVVSKPSGMPSVAHAYDETETLANFLLAHCPQLVGTGPAACGSPLSRPRPVPGLRLDRGPPTGVTRSRREMFRNSPLEPGMVQRLDTFTSGLMVAAKTAESFKNLKKQFRTRKILKEYLALVEGVVKESGEICHPIGTDPKNIRKVGVYEEKRGMGVQEAITQYRPEQSFPHRTLLRVRIITGVRHQIRAHLAFLGHPVVGDTLYGSKTEASRLCLHASKLGFEHPVTGKWVEFDDSVKFPAPPPSPPPPPVSSIPQTA